MNRRNLQDLLEKAREEFSLLYEVGNALRTTLDFDETLRIILSGVTAPPVLGLTRAAIFLVSPDQSEMAGRMGIGPEPFPATVTSLKIPLSERAGGLLAQAALEGSPIEVTSRFAPARVKEDPVLRALKSRSCILVPLKARDDAVGGVIFADNQHTRKPIPNEAFRLLALLAAHAGLAIENACAYRAALQQADRDSLTRLWNRGAFQRSLMKMTAQTQKLRQPAGLLLVDVDHFKAYNDRVGHLGGDEALSAVSRLLQRTARSGDYVARFGGEEFALLLPRTTKLNALKLAERIRLAMDHTGLPLTLSVGVATFPEDATSAEELLKAADRALYEAKHLGRNRVVLA